MLCIGVKKIKIHFDTSQLCCGVVHYGNYVILGYVTHRGNVGNGIKNSYYFFIMV